MEAVHTGLSTQVNAAQVSAAEVSAAQVSAQGLEGVIFAQTALSHVDGERGVLVIAGEDIEVLAEGARFEDAFARLMGVPAHDVRRLLGEARVRLFPQIAKSASLSAADGMDALRAIVGAMEGLAPRGLEMAIDLAASVALAAAAWQRTLHRGALIPPDASCAHAEDLLRMLSGELPDPSRVHALDRYLVTVMDHGMNASTFTARVVASTGSDALSSVVAAIGALKGPLHGGAPGPVLDMLDAVQTPDRAEAWIASELAQGKRIMGMGHRIYRVRDPRAAALEKGIEILAREGRGGDTEREGAASGRLGLARAVEKAAEAALQARHPERPLKCNVEFYTAILLDAVGIDRRAFSPTFAVGRVVGWCAHIEEQRRVGKLVRPASIYVGKMPTHL